MGVHDTFLISMMAEIEKILEAYACCLTRITTRECQPLGYQ